MEGAGNINFINHLENIGLTKNTLTVMQPAAALLQAFHTVHKFLEQAS
jgi:hypothetical protein